MLKAKKKEIEIKKNNSKLPLLLVDMPATESVTVMILANTGSRYETKREEGLAHFFEHMVFKGTKKFSTAKTLAETLDSVGADFNAFTSKEYTGYYVRAAAQSFHLAIDVLSDMILQPKLRQEDIDREKGVIIEELNMYVDHPAHHIANVFDQMIFADSQLSHDIIGRKETIRSFTKADFKNFLQKYYGIENLLLVIAGNITAISKNEKELFTTIEKNFSKLDKKRAVAKQAQPIYKDWSTMSAKDILEATQINQKAFSNEKFKLVKRKTEQAHFVMAWPAFDAHHKDRYVLSLLSAILGGNMSSRLFTQVREERGLAYYVRSEMDLLHDAGLLGCSAGVDPSRVKEAIKVSRQVFENLVSGKEPVTEKELERAKKYLRGKMLLSLESSNSVAQFFGFKELLLGDLMQIEEALELLEAVTLKDLERIAKLVIRNGELRFAMIGNFDNEAEIKALVA